MKKSYDFSKARRGAVIGPVSGKTRITIRIDDDVLEWFRKRAHDVGGASYQTMMNDALRGYAENQEEPLEETLRRILLEVVPGARKPKTRSRSTKNSSKNSSKKKTIKRRS